MSLRERVIRLAHAHPELRPHLLPLVHRQASGCSLVTGGQRLEYLDAVWAMYEKTYTAIGMHIPNPNGLLKYDTWEICLHDGVPVAFGCLESTPFGFKSGLGGFDGSPAGKAQNVHNLRTKYQRPGFYGEVSHKVKDIALAAGAEVVCSALVEQVIRKPIEPLPDGISYTRSLAGVGRVTKVLIGRPRGIPTTTAQNPMCPLEQEGRQATAYVDGDVDMEAMSHYASLILED